jgi:hypothetical protein
MGLLFANSDDAGVSVFPPPASPAPPQAENVSEMISIVSAAAFIKNFMSPPEDNNFKMNE